MRRYLLIVPILFACGPKETPSADSAAAAPAGLAEADVAGTWTGTVMPEGSDSVVGHWTQVCAAGTCRATSQEAPNDTVTATYTIEGDSIRGTSAPYKENTMMKGAMIIDSWVARPSGNQVTGHGMMKLADKPDSVVFRYHFTGTRNP